MSHLPLDARAILHYLNELGYRNISSTQLKEFLKGMQPQSETNDKCKFKSQHLQQLPTTPTTRNTKTATPLQTPATITAAATAQGTPSLHGIAKRSPAVKVIKCKKPLCNFKFYLDIRDHQLTKRIEEQIKLLGGSLEFFLTASVTHFVTDKPLLPVTVGTTNNNNNTSCPDTPQTPHTPQTPQTPYILECQESIKPNNGLTNKKPIRNSRADAILNRARRQSTINASTPTTSYQPNKGSTLDNISGTPKDISVKNVPTPPPYVIWQCENALRFFKKVQHELKEYLNHTNKATNKGYTVEPIHLKGGFIKIEALKRNYRPYYHLIKKPQEWPKIELTREDGAFRLSPKKDLNKEESQEIEQKSKHLENALPDNMTRKSRSKSTQNHHNNLKKNEQDHIKSPNISQKNNANCKNQTPKQLKESSDKQCGVCEICKIEYDALTIHLKTKDHEYFAKNSQNFIALDSLIHSSADVNKFLDENRKLKIKTELEDMEVEPEESTDPEHDSLENNDDEDGEDSQRSSSTHKQRKLQESKLQLYSPTLREKSQRSTKGKHSSEKFQHCATAATTKSPKTPSPQKPLASLALDVKTSLTKKKPTSTAALSPPIRAMLPPNSLYKVVESHTDVLGTPPRLKGVGKGLHHDPASAVASPSLIVKFKKVRTTELQVLNGEAENFMFPKRRCDSSDLPTDIDRHTTSDQLQHTQSSQQFLTTSSSEQDDDKDVDHIPLKSLANNKKAIAKGKRRLPKVSNTKSSNEDVKQQQSLAKINTAKSFKEDVVKQSFPKSPIQPKKQLKSEHTTTKQKKSVKTSPKKVILNNTNKILLPEATRKSSRTATAIVTAATTSTRLLQAAVNAAKNKQKLGVNKTPKTKTLQTYTLKKQIKEEPKPIEEYEDEETSEDDEEEDNDEEEENELEVKTKQLRCMRRLVVKLEDRMGEKIFKKPQIFNKNTKPVQDFKEDEEDDDDAEDDEDDEEEDEEDEEEDDDEDDDDGDVTVDCDDDKDKDYEAYSHKTKGKAKRSSLTQHNSPLSQLNRLSTQCNRPSQSNRLSFQSNRLSTETPTELKSSVKKERRSSKLSSSNRFLTQTPTQLNFSLREERLARRQSRVITQLQLELQADPEDEDDEEDEEEYKEVKKPEKSVNKQQKTSMKTKIPTLKSQQKALLSTSATIKSSIKSSPIKQSPIKQSPVKPSNIKPSPIKASPIKASPIKTSPIKPSPIKTSPIKQTPIKVFLPVKQEPSPPSRYFDYTKSERLKNIIYSFERLPETDIWYRVYKRQDNCEERYFEYFGSTKYRKLPYELGPIPFETTLLDQTKLNICCRLCQATLVKRGTDKTQKHHVRRDLLNELKREKDEQNSASEKQNELTTPSCNHDKSQTEHSKSTNYSFNNLESNSSQKYTHKHKKLHLLQRYRQELEQQELLQRKKLEEQVQITQNARLPNQSDIKAEDITQDSSRSREERAGSMHSNASSGASSTNTLCKSKKMRNKLLNKVALLANLELPPRKSPREHASTLALVSCIIKQRQDSLSKPNSETDEPPATFLETEANVLALAAEKLRAKEKTPPPAASKTSSVESSIPKVINSPRTRSQAATPVEELRFATEISETVKRMRRGRNKYDYSPPFTGRVGRRPCSTRGRGRGRGGANIVTSSLLNRQTLPDSASCSLTQQRSQTPNTNNTPQKPATSSTIVTRGRRRRGRQKGYNNTPRNTPNILASIRKTGSKKGVLEFDLDNNQMEALKRATTEYVNPKLLEWQIDKYLSLTGQEYEDEEMLTQANKTEKTPSEEEQNDEDAEENQSSNNAKPPSLPPPAAINVLLNTPPVTDYFSSDFDLYDLINQTSLRLQCDGNEDHSPQRKMKKFSIFNTVHMNKYYRKRKNLKSNRTGWPKAPKKKAVTRQQSIKDKIYFLQNGTIREEQCKNSRIVIKQELANMPCNEDDTTQEHTRQSDGVITPPDSDMELENREEKLKIQNEEEDDERSVLMEEDSQTVNGEEDEDDEDEEDEEDVDNDTMADSIENEIEPPQKAESDADADIEEAEEDEEVFHDARENDIEECPKKLIKKCKKSLPKIIHNDDEDSYEPQEKRARCTQNSPDEKLKNNLLNPNSAHTSTPTAPFMRALRRTPQLNGSLGSCISPSEKAGDNSDIFTVSSDGLDTDMDLSNPHSQLRSTIVGGDDNDDYNTSVNNTTCSATPKRKFDLSKYAPTNAATCAAEAATAAVKSLAISQFLKKEVRVTCRRLRAPFRRFRYRR